MKAVSGSTVLIFAVLLGLTAFTGCTESAADHQSVLLQAPGMHCEGCVQTVESTLKKSPGVDSVHADLKTKEVLVIVDTAKTGPAKLAKLIEEMGYATEQSPAESE